MSQENYYNILGVSETSSQDEIKKAYRQLAKDNHPDKGGDEDKFKKISVAYDILGDAGKRQQYDNQLKNPFANGGGVSMEDMINQMFGGRGFNQARQQAHTTNLNVEVGVLESFLGKRKTINYQRKKECNTCNGTGGEKKTCTVCSGSGRIVRQMGSGMFVQMIQTPCDACRGNGQILIRACYSCNGSGESSEMKTIDVQLPHGIDDGQFIRMKGMGDFKHGTFVPWYERPPPLASSQLGGADSEIDFFSSTFFEVFSIFKFIFPRPAGTWGGQIRNSRFNRQMNTFPVS